MELDISGARIFFTLPIDVPVLGPLRISETMVVSWIVMILITGLCIWLTHDLKEENISKLQTARMNFEFMTIDTPLPPCMPFPRALTGFPVSSTAKVMYCRMLDAMLSKGQEDENGILFVCFPVTAIAAVLSRSPMTVKRSLNELETAGLIMRVRQGVGEPNRIYVLIPGKEDAALA